MLGFDLPVTRGDIPSGDTSGAKGGAVPPFRPLVCSDRLRAFRWTETGERRGYRFTGEKEDRRLAWDVVAKQLEGARTR